MFLPSSILTPESWGIAIAATGDHPELVLPSPAPLVQAANAKTKIGKRRATRPGLTRRILGLSELATLGNLEVERTSWEFCNKLLGISIGI